MRFLLFIVLPALAFGANPLTSEAKADYLSVRKYMLETAREMPAGDYGFRPAPTVRTFAQQIAHVADDQYNLCGPVRGETKARRYQAIEETLKTKEELVPALEAAFAYCDAAYDSVTDANAGEMVQFFKASKTKFGMLNWNTWHTWEHYGNLVVYLRIKGMVPPSSAPNKNK